MIPAARDIAQQIRCAKSNGETETHADKNDGSFDNMPQGQVNRRQPT